MERLRFYGGVFLITADTLMLQIIQTRILSVVAWYHLTFWGINGAAGVLASALAVASSIAFGIGVTLVIGSVCYLLLAPAALVIGFGTSQPAAVAAPRPA